MKILLFCPTYKLPSGKLAIKNKTVESINALIIPAEVDLAVKISDDNPFPITGVPKDDHRNTLHQYQLARDIVLDQGFDALWTVEHDMVIPPDALLKLLDTKADVVYGLYVFRSQPKTLNAMRFVKADHWDSSVSNFPELAEKGFQQGWLEVSGVGFGCTLIYRRVLEKLEMRGGDHPAPDNYFATDCLRAGFKQVCRFDVQCGHINNDVILWPLGGDNLNTVKIYVNVSFNANLSGRSEHFEAGSEAEMPESDALEYARAGFVTIVPAVKIVNKPTQKAKAVK